MAITQYPKLISEQNFHWTYEHWQDKLADSAEEAYISVCEQIEESGYPSSAEKFEFFIASSVEEMKIKVIIRILSCLYAYEQGELTYDDAWALIEKVSIYATLALQVVHFFHYGDEEDAIVALEGPPPEPYY